MLMKMLPGIGLAIALGLVFSLAPAPKKARPRPGREIEPLPRFSASAQIAGHGGQVVAVPPRQPIDPVPAKTPDTIAAVARTNSFTPTAQPGLTGAANATPAPALADAGLLMAASTAAVHQAPMPAAAAPNAFPANPLAPTAPGGVGSDNAFASVPACSSPANTCPDPPDKGIYIWGKAFHDKEKMDLEPGKYSAYDMDSTTLTLGFMKDWSPTTRLGLSIDLLDAEVKSKHAGDSFKNDVTGWILNADVATAVGKYNIDGKILYGQPELKGSGLANGLSRVESKHKATLYGFSGKVGIPLKFGDSIKLAPDLGINYRKLKSKAYDYTLNGFNMSAESQDSESLAIPLTVAMKKDIEFCAGIFTPRVTLGVIKEFKDTGLAFRTFNASAASYASPTGMADKAPSWIYQAGLGMDLITHNGWNVTLDYTYYWGGKYSNDSFGLGIGKCF